MRNPTLQESIEICSTKKHFLVLKDILDTKGLIFDEDKITQNKTLKSIILEEAKVLSNRILELHDRISNCVCFSKSDRKVECSSYEANEMQKHHETLKKLLKDIEEIEAREFGLQDMKLYVPTKRLNPLSNPFVPSAKIYEQISAAPNGEDSATDRHEVADRKHEKSTDQTSVHNADVSHQSYEMVDISLFPYSLDEKIRSLWLENKTQYCDSCFFLINLYGRDLNTPQKYKTIWSITDEEKKLNSRYSTISTGSSDLDNTTLNICATSGGQQPCIEFVYAKWEPFIDQAQKANSENEISGSHEDHTKKMTMEVTSKRIDNLFKAKRVAEARRSLPILPSSPNSKARSHHHMEKQNVQKSLSFPNWAVKWPSGGNDTRALNQINKDTSKIEAGFCQVTINSSTCDHPCSNWCDAKQLKNVSETRFEENCSQFSNTLTSRQRNAQDGNQNSKITGILCKPDKISCHQSNRSILPATFMKQSNTIFDTDQWSASKLAEFRSRRDSGDSGYSSVEQSEHEFKLQPCLATTETLFSGCSDDFSKSEFENEFWTPLPNCKRMYQNVNRHESSHWDPTRNIRKNRRGRPDDICFSQPAVKIQRENPHEQQQQASKVKKPVKRDFVEQKPKKK